MGWEAYVHPEGNIYYGNPQTRVVSDTDPRQNGVLAAFNAAMETVRNQLSDASKSGNIEVFLIPTDMSTTSPELVIEYYVVDYDHRSIFWVEDVEIVKDLFGSARIDSMEHLRKSRISTIKTGII
ncbi:hypothetical protein FRC00_009595 [Tulasnella sp. 408]|nr:hypothetical protein FRC00_009595 [Tulasnella sp. 408]